MINVSENLIYNENERNNKRDNDNKNDRDNKSQNNNTNDNSNMNGNNVECRLRVNKIAIIGLGLIGGSLSKALRRTNPDFKIYGSDNNPDNVTAAYNDGTIDEAYENLEDIVKEAEVIFLCMPVHAIIGTLNKISRWLKPGTIISDVGSTKQEIMAAAGRILPEDVYFIGGHPMAGTEQSGYSASIPHLFENAYYILTPNNGTPDKVIRALKGLVASTGALPLVLNPETHDELVGAISHLPHVIAGALVNTIADLKDPDHYIQKLAAGGFKDITRIASSNPLMWRDISLSNKQPLLQLISAIINKLNEFGLSLENNEAAAVEDFYTSAKVFRDQLPSQRSLFLLPYYELYVDVEDIPGIIGQVTTLLGEHNVNIKNIRIINSREDEPGCLVLSLPDPDTQDKALSLLSSNGFKSYKR